MMYRKKGFATLVPHNMTELQVTLGSSGKAGDKHWMIDMNTNTNTNKIVIYGTMSVVFVRLIGQQNQLLFISLKMKFGNQFVCSVFCVCCVHIPLQLSVEHYHCRHAHKHEHKGINNGLPPAQGGCDNGRGEHEPTKGFAAKQIDRCIY